MTTNNFMRVRACLLVSALTGCGLVQVNGKPLGGGSSSSSTSTETSSSSEEAPSAPAEPAGSPAPTQDSQVAAAASPARATGSSGKKHLEDFEKRGAKLGTWSPLQQYYATSQKGSGAAYAYKAFMFADELGDRLSQAGRLGVIEACLGGKKKDATSSSLWAACAADVDAFDSKALAAELQAEGLTNGATQRFMTAANETLDEAKAVGAAVAEAAKGDPGVAQIVAMGKTARDEWKAFASDHAEQLTELAKLQDLVRENKNGLAGDCLAKTRPAMEKVVRATKWREQDDPVDPSFFYVNLTPTTTGAFIATAAWGACLVLTHKSGAAIYMAATQTEYGYQTYRFKRYQRRGPRTLTIAKLYEDPFKPAFADRSLDMRNAIEDPHVFVRSEVEGSQTPHEAVIAKLVKSGDETTVKFAAEKVIRCVHWEDTNSVERVLADGSVMYRKKCMRREPVDNEYSDIVTSTAFTDGLGGGITITEQFGFPVVGSRGNKFVTALGIKL